MARVHIYSVGCEAGSEGARTISSREGYYEREGMRWLIFSQLHSCHMARCHNLKFQSGPGKKARLEFVTGNADFEVDREEVAGEPGQSDRGARALKA
jgi:hypothetical protein